MGSIAHIHDANARDVLATRAFSAGGLAEGTNAATIKTVAAVDYSIKGKMYTKAITDNIAMAPAASQADATTCYYLVEIDTAGAVTLNKGTDGGNIPAKSSDAKCAIGVMKIVNTSGAAFVVGTTDLGAAGITDTFSDITVVPVDAAEIGM